MRQYISLQKTIVFLSMSALALSMSACTPSTTSTRRPQGSVSINDDLEAGRNALHKLLEKEPSEVEKEIKALRQAKIDQSLAEDVEAQREAFADRIFSGKENIWSYYTDACILGDSRAEPFFYLNYLPENQVHAKKNQRVNDAYDALDSVLYNNPSILIFTYGLNGVKADDDAVDAFGAAYQEVARTYADSLPDASLYFCSIMPVTEDALSAEPNFSYIENYNDVIQHFCEENSYHYIDCDQLASDYEDHYEPDGVHFDSSFYPIWAEYIMEEILFDD